MPSPKYAFCLFCDDIRPEVGNKFSYMGVYRRDMVFPPGAPLNSPIYVPKFGIVAWVTSDIDDRPKHIKFRVFVPPGKTEIQTSEIEVDQIENKTSIEPGSLKYTVSSFIPIIGLMLQTSGFIEVTAEVDGEEMRAGRLKIVIPDRPSSDQTTSADATALPPDS